MSSSAIAGNAPIISGTADAGDPAVVQIYAYPTTKDTLYTCTGIVLAPKAILTAGHCLDHTGYIFGVFFGSGPSSKVSATLRSRLQPPEKTVKRTCACSLR